MRNIFRKMLSTQLCDIQGRHASESWYNEVRSLDQA